MTGAFIVKTVPGERQEMTNARANPFASRHEYHAAKQYHPRRQMLAGVWKWCSMWKYRETYGTMLGW